MCSLMNAWGWNTWGPLARSTEAAFGWDNAEIAQLSNWATISFVVAAFPSAWIIDVKGLRWACLTLGALTCCGNAVKCISSEPVLATWMINIGKILNDLGQAVAMSAPPLLSAVWFPAHQRTTITSLATSPGSIGTAIGYIAGPLIVSDYLGSGNSSSSNHSIPCDVAPCNITNLTNTDSLQVKNIRTEIMYYMYLQFALSAILFVMLVIYFPAKPPHPPSHSARTERVDFKKGILQIVKTGQFWIVCLPFVLSNGMLNAWCVLIGVIFKPIGVPQETVGWVGFIGTVGGIIAMVIIGKFSDVFAKRMKTILITLCVIAMVSMLCFSLMYDRLLPRAEWVFFVTTIVAFTVVDGATPIFYELACECTYPVAEGVTSTVFNLASQVSGFIFYLTCMIPNIGTSWMNWTLMGAVTVSLPLLVLFRESHSRLEIDTNDRTDENTAKIN